MTIRIFGYPFNLYTKEGGSFPSSLRVDILTLNAMLSNVESKLRAFSRNKDVNRRVNEFALVPNPVYLRNEGYEVIGYDIPSEQDTFIGPDGLISRNCKVVFDKPFWILKCVEKRVDAAEIVAKEKEKDNLQIAEEVII